MKKILCVFLILFISGCADEVTSERPSEGEAFEEGFDLVEAGRYENAILYFQNLYQSNPTDDALKAWASVYVSRAGLKVSTLYDAYKTLPTQTRVTRNNLLPLIKAYQQGLEKIPYAQDQDRVDLQTAYDILHSRSSPSVRLFRAMVGLVLLRSTFSDGSERILDADFKIDLDKNLKIVCKIDWRRFRAWLQTWTVYGVELSDDLMIAFPEQAKDYEESKKFFVDSRDLSTTVTTVCNP